MAAAVLSVHRLKGPGPTVYNLILCQYLTGDDFKVAGSGRTGRVREDGQGTADSDAQLRYAALFAGADEIFSTYLNNDENSVGMDTSFCG